MSTPINELESDLQSDVESEGERDLESELENINDQLDTTTIALSGAPSNHNYKKIASKEPVLSLMIPNILFSLWRRRREIEERLMQEKSTLTGMANASLNKIIKLNTCASDLAKRMPSFSRELQKGCRKAQI